MFCNTYKAFVKCVIRCTKLSVIIIIITNKYIFLGGERHPDVVFEVNSSKKYKYDRNMCRT